MRPDLPWKIAKHCQLLRFFIAEHVFDHFLISVVDSDGEKRKKVRVEAHSTHHDETLHDVLKVGPGVNVSEAEPSH